MFLFLAHLQLTHFLTHLINHLPPFPPLPPLPSPLPQPTTPPAEQTTSTNPPPQERLQKSKQGGGKLKAQLDQRRGMTDAEALRQASETEQRQRDLDQSTRALTHS